MGDSESKMRQRGVPAILLSLAVLAFLLPFGTVSCGTSVTFTGAELATAQVEGDDPELVADIEDYAPVAGFAAIAALLAFVLAAAGTRGVGSASLAALLALLYLPWAALGAMAEVVLHAVYVFSTALLAAVVVLRAVTLRERRHEKGRAVWPVTIGAWLVMMMFVITLAIGVAG